MFEVKKTLEISAAHKLRLDYNSPCGELHGHNWKITVTCRSMQLDDNDMVVDFAKIKRIVHDKFDHKNMNEVVGFNPTAENLAKYICESVPHCVRVDVEESPNNVASYMKEVQ